MHAVVALPFVAAGEPSTARAAREGSFAGVRPDVRCEVVASAKRSVADGADERLLTGVNSEVTRQLIGARETSRTVDGRTDVRPRSTHFLDATGGDAVRR